MKRNLKAREKVETYHEEDITFGKVYDAAIYRRLLSYIKPFPVVVGLTILLIPLKICCDLMMPKILQIVINGPMLNADFKGIAIWAVVFFAVLIGSGGIAVVLAYLVASIAQQAVYRIRMDAFERLTSLSSDYYSQNPVGRLMTRVTNDIESISEFFSNALFVILEHGGFVVGIVLVMFVTNWRYALVVVTVVPFFIAGTTIFRIVARKIFRRERAIISRMNGFLQENLSGIRIVQIFNREKKNISQFESINDDLLATRKKAVFTFATFIPTIEMIAGVGLTVLLGYGVFGLEAGYFEIGTVFMFLWLTERFYWPIRELSEKFTMLQSAMASSERVFRIIDTGPAVKDPPEARTFDMADGRVDFEGVDFSYVKGEPVIKGFDLTINPGEKLAIVGHTGAGKSTLINLLCRFYDVSSGRVAVDGIDVRKLRQMDLRKHIGLVLQDVFLFHGTIADNIRLENESISDADVRAASDLVRLDRCLARLPRGLDTDVNEQGVSLSAGERQLIAFARALVFNPRILILDEATSNIDTETEILIREATDTLLADRTAIIVAHRLSTIEKCDRIIVMHRGRIVESGDHRSLLAANGRYRKLYELQYKEQENVA